LRKFSFATEPDIYEFTFQNFKVTVVESMRSRIGRLDAAPCLVCTLCNIYLVPCLGVLINSVSTDPMMLELGGAMVGDSQHCCSPRFGRVSSLRPTHDFRRWLSWIKFHARQSL